MSDLNSFPSYIGFGRLRPDTITETDIELTADYFFEEKSMHQVTFKKNQNSWLIRDNINKNGRYSGGKTLKHATMIHFLNLDCSTDPTYQYVENSVCKLGNIYFQYLPTQTNNENISSYYPAGRLVVFRLPVLKVASENHKTKFLEKNIQFKNILKLNNTYDSLIISTSKNGEKKIISVQMFEYIITLASVYDAAEWLCENDLISREKHLRMVIQDASHKMQTTSLTFPGTPEDTYLNYTILFKGVNHQKDEFSALIERLISVIPTN